jgi:hypothetical protein
MNLPHPAVFRPEFLTERLTLIARWLLEELHATEDDLVRDTDDGYSRGCTGFARQRMRIMKEAVSGRHDWLALSNATNALVFTIVGTPCRFSNDDPDNPKKDAVLQANRQQQLFVSESDREAPSRFCFVIDRGLDGIDDPHVELLGFNAQNELMCRWVSSAVRVVHVANNQPVVEAVEVAKPVVAPKRRDGDEAAPADKVAS